MSKNIPTIEISLDGYAFKKLLGVSLIERNVRFLNAFGFKEINFNCDENLIGYLTDFISYDFFLNRESWSFSINSIQNSTFSLNSNDIFDYAGIESDKSEENIFDRMNNRKIDTIKSKKDMEILCDYINSKFVQRIFNCFRYRMRYLEREAFLFVPDVLSYLQHNSNKTMKDLINNL